MKIKQITINIITVFGIVVGLVAIIAATTPAMAVNSNCGTDTNIIDCSNVSVDNDSDDITRTGLWSILLTVINILAVGVGVAAVGGIVYGSILYASSEGSPDKVKKARNIIVDVVIGLVMFVVMYAALNFLIPGGVFF